MTKKFIKCLVWDLDDTLWERSIAIYEGERTLRSKVRWTVETLASRGILQSIASLNDYHPAYDYLEQTGLADYFLFPQINLEPKSKSILAIASHLGLNPDSMAFIDDNDFHLMEAKANAGIGLVLHADMVSSLCELPHFQPPWTRLDIS